MTTFDRVIVIAIFSVLIAVFLYDRWVRKNG